MKRFLLNISLFSAPLILLFLSIEVYLSQSQNSELKHKAELFKEAVPKTEVLILGSSQSFYGIDPEGLSRPAFNAAYVSQDVTTDYELFSTYQEELKELKAVVLPLSYISLRWNLPESPEPFRTVEYHKAYGFVRSRSPKDNFYVFAYRPHALWERIKAQQKSKPIRDITALGYLARKTMAEDLDLRESAEIALSRHRLPNQSVQYNKDILKKFVSACENKNLPLVLLITPTTEEYYSQVDSEQWNEVVSFCDSLQENDNVVFLNLMTSNRFDSKDFFDADHLAKSGAEKLSAILDSTIEFSVK